MANVNGLVKLGLTNTYTEDFASLAMARTTIKAWCTSDACLRNFKQFKRGQKVLKDTRRDECPDCGHALFYSSGE